MGCSPRGCKSWTQVSDWITTTNQGGNVLCMSQMKKLRHEETKELAKEHRTSTWQSRMQTHGSQSHLTPTLSVHTTLSYRWRAESWSWRDYLNLYTRPRGLGLPQFFRLHLKSRMCPISGKPIRVIVTLNLGENSHHKLFAHTHAYIQIHRLNALGVCVCQSCPPLCDPMDCRLPGSSVHGISQARILKWIAVSFSRGSFPPRDGSCVSCISALAGRVFTSGVTWEATTIN